MGDLPVMDNFFIGQSVKLIDQFVKRLKMSSDNYIVLKSCHKINKKDLNFYTVIHGCMCKNCTALSPYMYVMGL